MRRHTPRITRARLAHVVSVLVVGASVAALGAPLATPAPAAAASATSAFRALTPCRLLDTRDPGQTKPAAGGTVTLPVRGRCGVSADATAVSVTVTVTEPAGSGFITAWPSGQPRPLTSSNNYQTGENRANGALLALGADGNLALYTSNAAHLIVDVSGEFATAPAATAGRYVPVTPARLLDTRNTGGPLPAGGTVTVALPGGVPTDATALAVQITTTAAPTAGFLTAYPAGSTRPNTSVLNTDGAYQPRTATQIVPVSPAGMAVYAFAGGHVIVDMTGYFTGPSAPSTASGLFVSTTPTRVLDTRDSTQIYPGGTVLTATSTVTGGDVAGIAGNVTVTQTQAAGYATVWAAKTAQPPTASITFSKAGETVANLALVSVSNAGLAIGAYAGTHAVIDITGWFVGTPVATTGGSETPVNTGPGWPQPTGPVGCLPSIPAPSADGVYQVFIGTNQTVVHIFTPGPRGPIVVVGDSLTYGSAPQAARVLRTQGWGPICIDGTISRTIEFGSSSVPDGLDATARIKASNAIWNDPRITWVVALGTNDVSFSAGNTQRADKYIGDMRAAIGTNPVWWMNVRTGRADQQFAEAMWNQSIVTSGVHLIDWYTQMNPAWLGPDKIHLTSVGYQGRADLYSAVTP